MSEPTCPRSGPVLRVGSGVVHAGFDFWDGHASFLCEEYAETRFVRGYALCVEIVRVDEPVNCMACLGSAHYDAYLSNVVAWEGYEAPPAG